MPTDNPPGPPADSPSGRESSVCGSPCQPSSTPTSYAARTTTLLTAIVRDAESETALTAPLDICVCGPTARGRLQVWWQCDPRLPEPDEAERAILRLLYLRPGTGYCHILRCLEAEGCHRRTLERRLKKLRRRGLVTSRPGRGYDLDPAFRARLDAATSEPT